MPPNSHDTVPLEAVVTMAELGLRPSRAADHEGVKRALVALAQEMANSPTTILQKLVDTALHLCQAHSAGISILEEENGRKIFRWHALAGRYASHVRETTPREFSPCGTVLDRDSLQLMRHLDRHFTYFADFSPRIVEALLIPFHVGGEARGTIWVLAHDEHRRFDAEDARVLNEVGVFAAAANQVLLALEARRLASAELERRVEERTRELEAQTECLRRSNVELERFAYVSSHDLQEPLRMVVNFTQLLATRYAGKLGPDADEYIHFAVDGALRMQTLIRDLLAYARANGVDRPDVVVDLDAALEKAVANLGAAIRESGTRIEAGPLPSALGNSARITQVFQHLLANGIKFRGKEAPLLRVGLTSRTPIAIERGRFVIEVADNGIGIEPEYFDRIFEPFRRLHTREEYPGNGIGLAICKKIVEQHGGQLGVTSEPGKGSAFFFSLRQADARESQPLAPRVPEPDARASS